MGEPEDKPADGTRPPIDVTRLIAAGFAVVSGAAALVGGFTGAIPRLLRNEPDYFLLAIAFALLAVGLTLGASVLDKEHLNIKIPRFPKREVVTDPNGEPVKKEGNPNKDKKRLKWRFRQWTWPWRLALTIAAFVVFCGAAGILIYGFSNSLQRSDQPRISITWKTTSGQQPIASVSVSLDGVKISDTVYVFVFPGTKLVQGPSNVAGTIADFPIYRAQSGANQDGVADVSFDVQLPAGYAALQIVASLNEPTTCSGAKQTATVPQSSASTANATAAPASTAPLYPKPVTGKPAFSCITVVAPVNGAVPSASPPVPTS
jgi:hypothetical protein